jgi:hypothetical protein
VTFDEVMDALRALDREAQTGGEDKPHYRRVIERVRSPSWRRQRRGGWSLSGGPRLG